MNVLSPFLHQLHLKIPVINIEFGMDTWSKLGNTPSVPKYKVLESSNSRNNSERK
jgi:hypothetical protein